MNTPYRYTVLRYMHDIVSGEFLNVGLLLYSQPTAYLRGRFLPRAGRISRSFPDLDTQALRDLLRYVQTQYEAVGERLQKELSLSGGPTGLEVLAESVLPRDDSALQWSSPRHGITDDLDAELERLYERLVGRYENRPRHQARDDADIWAQYRRELEACDVTPFLRARTITYNDSTRVLQHSVKAPDRWLSLEPISFDLVDAEKIRAKGYRWFGEMTIAAPALQDTTLYLLIGEAKNENCRNAFTTALNTIHRIPVAHEIVREHEAAQLSSSLARLVAEHRKELGSISAGS